MTRFPIIIAALLWAAGASAETNPSVHCRFLDEQETIIVSSGFDGAVAVYLDGVQAGRHYPTGLANVVAADGQHHNVGPNEWLCVREPKP